MKGIKTLFGALAVAGLLLSGSAFAQENGNRDENGKVVRGPYETNGFWQNWFIGIGGGIQTTYGIINSDLVQSLIPLKGWVGEIQVGKWITPEFGFRLVDEIGSNKVAPANGVTQNFDRASKGWANAQGYLHFDALWNISNTFGGYKETRFWDFIPYFQAGVVDFHGVPAGNGFKAVVLEPMNLDFAAGFGLINDLRLGKRVDLYLDLSLPVVRSANFKFGGNVSNKRIATIGFMPAAKLGLIFNLGRTNFDRHSSVTPVIVPVPFTVEQYNALKDRVAALEKENAALKEEIEALKNQAPDTVYVGTNNVESPAYAFFEMGSAKLSDREKLHLDFFCDNVVANLAEDKGLLVTGSADSATGSAKRNTALSEQRAQAVKDYFVGKGVAADRIETEVLGGIDGGTDARRVVVTVK